MLRPKENFRRSAPAASKLSPTHRPNRQFSPVPSASSIGAASVNSQRLLQTTVCYYSLIISHFTRSQDIFARSWSTDPVICHDPGMKFGCAMVTGQAPQILCFCHAPLGVCSAKCRHQSPEWTLLSNVSCFIQREVIGFQVLLDSLHPHSTIASKWSPPVLPSSSQILKINH